jgi:hypothetical protein
VDNPEAWLERVCQIISQFDIDVWIPTCEETFYAAHFRQAVPCQVMVDSIETLDSLHDKWKFTHLAHVDETQAPKTLPLWDESDLQPYQSNSVEWVFKPMYSRFASQTLIGPTWEELRKIQPTSSRGWVAQRKIVGREMCTFSICSHGKTQAHVCYESKYRAGKGAGIYLVPRENAAISSYATALVEKLDYSGMLGLDVIQSDDGSIWPIEANPRATSGMHLLEDQAEILSTFQGNCQQPVGDNGRAFMVGFAMPTWGLADAWRKGKVRRFLMDIFKARDVVWKWTDPLPSVIVFPAMAEFGMAAWKRKISLHDATTWDMEWNGTIDLSAAGKRSF